MTNSASVFSFMPKWLSNSVHTLETRDKYSPWYNPGPKLVQHVCVNIVCQVQGLPLFLLISLVEREWFLNRFCTSNACFFIFIASGGILWDDLLVSRLSGWFGNFIRLKLILNHPFLCFSINTNIYNSTRDLNSLEKAHNVCCSYLKEFIPYDYSNNL